MTDMNFFFYYNKVFVCLLVTTKLIICFKLKILTAVLVGENLIYARFD